MSPRRLGALLAIPGLAVPPAVNQVEMHPGWRNDELLAYCLAHRVHVTAYSPLGHVGTDGRKAAANGQHGRAAITADAADAAGAAGAAGCDGDDRGLSASLLEATEVVQASRALSLTPAQTLIRWAVARGCSAIPRSSRPERIAENAAALGQRPTGFGKISSSVLAGSAETDVPAVDEALRGLDGLPQRRRLRGEALVGRGKKGFASLEELWE